jgi:hypothetical protein
VGAEQLVEHLAVAFGKTLHAQQRALAAQDREDRHQQHPPLRQGRLKVVSCRAHGHASKSQHSPDVVAQLLLACVR